MRFHQGSTRVPQGCVALRFHRVPQSSARIAGSTRLHNAPPRVPSVVRPSSEKPSDQDRFAHGRNTKQNRNQWFLAHFHCFVTCSLAQANVGFVANQITSLRNSRCSRVNAWHCCLVGFGFQEFHEAARAMRSQGFHQILQKLWGSPEERFQQSFTLSSKSMGTRKLRENGLRFTGARLHRRGPIGPDCAIAPRSGPDSIGPRQL